MDDELGAPPTAPLPEVGEFGEKAIDVYVNVGPDGLSKDLIEPGKTFIDQVSKVEDAATTISNLRQQQVDIAQNTDKVVALLQSLENWYSNVGDVLDMLPEFPGKDALKQTVGRLTDGLADKLRDAREGYERLLNNGESEGGGGNDGGNNDGDNNDGPYNDKGDDSGKYPPDNPPNPRDRITVTVY